MKIELFLNDDGRLDRWQATYRMDTPRQQQEDPLAAILINFGRRIRFILACIGALYLVAVAIALATA